MKFTTATIATAALIAVTASANAQCVDPLLDTGCTLRTMSMFAVKSILSAPLAIVNAAEETFDSVTGAFCGEDVCNSPAPKAYAYPCAPCGKYAKKAACAPCPKKAVKCSVNPTFSDYVFGFVPGLAIGPAKYFVAGAEEGITKGYCAARGNWVLAPFAAYPAGAFYGAVGAIKGVFKGPFVGGPCGWANMRCAGKPFSIYMK
ncbi:MAG: hypothetical protein PHX74_08965 [Candidatus Sumerlaeales bacterium]|nr:hypothetical protein [Candidatus Sumerlaeales bacterium]